MIEYELKDAAGNTFPLNGATVTTPLKNTWSQGGDSFSFDNKIIEKTYLPGSTFVGESRLMGRELTLTVEKTNPDAGLFRDEVNTLLDFVSRTKFIVDVTNDMEIEVVVGDVSADYASGSLKHYAGLSFSFSALTPYWQALTATVVTGTALTDTILQVLVDNQGFLPSPGLITLTTTAAVISLQLFLTASSVGIQIDDSIFGTAGNLTMIVDNILGEVTIGALNRNDSIIEGTGFFDFIVGSNTLNILAADQDVDFTIEFYKRYFV